MRKDTVKKILTLVAMLGLLAGCATNTPDVTTFYDQITGLRTDLMAENELETAGPPREVVWLNASRVFRDSRRAEYYLEVAYMAMAEVGYLEIPAGSSLTLVVDGKTMPFDGTGSQNMRKAYKKDFVRENAIYPVTREQLQTIAGARQVKVRIQGRNGLIERDFSSANFDRLRRFVTAYAL